LTARYTFSDANFHINSKVNQHNVHVCGTENPHITIKHQRDSSKVYSSLFLIGNTTTSNSNLGLPYGLFQREGDSNDLFSTKMGCYLTSTWLCGTT
jgi:hypothetical protein